MLFFQFNKHLFVHIGQSNPSYSDAYLESVDVRQIYDKFPEKKGGLKELFEKGPHNTFFLVKFWVRQVSKLPLKQPPPPAPSHPNVFSANNNFSKLIEDKATAAVVTEVKPPNSAALV